MAPWVATNQLVSRAWLKRSMYVEGTCTDAPTSAVDTTRAKPVRPLSRSPRASSVRSGFSDTSPERVTVTRRATRLTSGVPASASTPARATPGSRS